MSSDSAGQRQRAEADDLYNHLISPTPLSLSVWVRSRQSSHKPT